MEKNRTDNLYLILVIQDISPKQIYEYIHSGVNEIVDATISEESLRQILSVLPRLKNRKTCKRHLKHSTCLFGSGYSI